MPNRTTTVVRFPFGRTKRDQARSTIIRANLDLKLQQEVAWMTGSAVEA